ncbi:hypothetical protein PDESU_03035 [Pontiella desulfatans]|uniref:RES domain-containing protein n=1 Tax=Pontiella desulfatans TaxID=2750659 RepID=A0A6C2U3J9_PONDE|nr:RES family NAD+ phosphorylase [Pontiella desulfatans]VGO14473.1 hypothetical protein PDESU_03035 [Pontiella desulfatans]
MPRAWRLVHKKYAASAFSGEGSRLAGGRWNSEGYPVVYTAGSLSLALLEIIVHLEFKKALQHYKAIPVDIPESELLAVDASRLPSGWNEPLPHSSTLLIGNRWLQDQGSAAMMVPSSIVPIESNFLLNPQHPGFGKLTIGTAIDLPLDPRVLNKLK